MIPYRNAKYYFNPRSREGSDDAARSPVLCTTYISIHAPARGATKIHMLQHGRIPISIHAPARGATSGANRFLTILFISIHAPARGATIAISETRHPVL